MDYSSMKATKESKKKLDTNVSISRKDSKKIKKTVKKMKLNWLLVTVVLVLGIAIGFVSMHFAFAKDTFEMNAFADNQIDITIGKDETYSTYSELGAKCIAFGKDYSSEVTVTYYYRTDLTQTQVKVDGIDTTKAGIYYCVYEVNVPKYKSIKLIRNVIVLEEEN